jgi:hypothetical protein
MKEDRGQLSPLSPPGQITESGFLKDFSGDKFGDKAENQEFQKV